MRMRVVRPPPTLLLGLLLAHSPGRGRTSLTQYEFSTRSEPILRPTRSSATLRRLRAGFSCVMPWLEGLP
jgi:hypothetical protein